MGSLLGASRQTAASCLRSRSSRSLKVPREQRFPENSQMASRTWDLESRTGWGGRGLVYSKAKSMNEVDVAGGAWFRQGSHGEREERPGSKSMFSLSRLFFFKKKKHCFPCRMRRGFLFFCKLYDKTGQKIRADPDWNDTGGFLPEFVHSTFSRRASETLSELRAFPRSHRILSPLTLTLTSF